MGPLANPHSPSPLAGEGGPVAAAIGPDGDPRQPTFPFPARRGRWSCRGSDRTGWGPSPTHISLPRSPGKVVRSRERPDRMGTLAKPHSLKDERAWLNHISLVNE